jgi:hypothetical protein
VYRVAETSATPGSRHSPPSLYLLVSSPCLPSTRCLPARTRTSGRGVPDHSVNMQICPPNAYVHGSIRIRYTSSSRTSTLCFPLPFPLLESLQLAVFQREHLSPRARKPIALRSRNIQERHTRCLLPERPRPSPVSARARNILPVLWPLSWPTFYSLRFGADICVHHMRKDLS